jgi:hypothetical protein
MDIEVTYKVKKNEKNRKAEKTWVQSQGDNSMNDQDLIDRTHKRKQEYKKIDPIINGSK